MKQSISYMRKQLLDIYPPEEVQAIIFLLLEKKFHYSKLDFCMSKDRTLSANEQQELTDITQRLRKKEPIQYILGEADFCGHTFKVTPDTLIPRPETAELVQWITEVASPNNIRSILDIGTGSGCIAISLASNLPKTYVEGWDISRNALCVAKQNSQLLDIPVEFRQQDIFATPLPNVHFNIIVSNPPYITENEKKDMNENVLDWEPSTALFVPNHDPLCFYRSIAYFAKQALTPSGFLFFEINQAFGTDIKDLLHDMGFSHVELRKDLFNNERMIKASI